MHMFRGPWAVLTCVGPLELHVSSSTPPRLGNRELMAGEALDVAHPLKMGESQLRDN